MYYLSFGKSMIPRVKICCISSIHEARLAIQYGASAIGLVGHMPSGPGVISDELILGIVRDIPPPIATFLLTSHTAVRDIIIHHQRVSTNTIQIVDALSEGTYWNIREIIPSVKIVQVIHVIDESSIEEGIKLSPYVDAVLLDSGNPNLKVKELGGTGRVHNWKLSRQIVESISIPVFLAGGLNVENVRRAIDEVGSFGLDLCSGVRSQGRLDEKKLEQFMRAIV
ncbi:MAG: phosphoribosylanthranilate isomerase [Saprospiraceae bacterium]